jgi:phospholipid/cholesterol/gamma-HCH transport system substrate-binding protein
VYGDVSGINDASPVLYNGMKVGQVIGTEMLPDGSGRIAVSFQIHEKQLKLTKDTKAEIFSSDFFTRSIRIIQGTSPELATKGDTLNGGAQLSLTETVNQQIDPLKRKAEGMLANVDSILTSLQLILNVDARKDIDASFSSLRGTLDNVRNTTQRLDALLAAETTTIHATLENLNKVSGTLANNSDELGRIFSNMDSLSASLADGRLDKIMANVTATSDQLKATLAGLEEGKGTMGKLMKDDSLYVNLNQASHQLDLLLEDLRTNPNRYFSVFGKKDRLPKLSDADIERIQQSYQKQQQP